MKKIVLALLLGISASAVYAQSVLPIDATDCSNAFFKALQEEDASTLANLLSSDFSITSFEGQQINRDFLMQAVTNGYLVVDNGMISGIRTREYGNVSVVTGNWNVRGRLQNYNFQNDVAYMVICIKSGGSWKVSAAQLTPVRQ